MNSALATQNGHGIGSQVIELLLADPDFIPSMKAAIMGGLHANNKVWAKGAVTADEVEDFKTRLEAAKLALAYGEGLPLQRIMQQTLVETRGDLHDALRESPQLLAAVEREVEKAKFRKRHVKQAAPVELEAP